MLQDADEANASSQNDNEANLSPPKDQKKDDPLSCLRPKEPRHADMRSTVQSRNEMEHLNWMRNSSASLTEG